MPIIRTETNSCYINKERLLIFWNVLRNKLVYRNFYRKCSSLIKFIISRGVVSSVNYFHAWFRFNVSLIVQTKYLAFVHFWKNYIHRYHLCLLPDCVNKYLIDSVCDFRYNKVQLWMNFYFTQDVLKTFRLVQTTRTSVENSFHWQNQQCGWITNDRAKFGSDYMK